MRQFLMDATHQAWTLEDQCSVDLSQDSAVTAQERTNDSFMMTSGNGPRWWGEPRERGWMASRVGPVEGSGNLGGAGRGEAGSAC